jgi:hypothetical protein
LTHTIPTPNSELLAAYHALKNRVRVLDAEIDALITQREYTENEMQSRVLAAEIVRLTALATSLEKQAHEIYRRMFTNLIAVTDDGEVAPAEIVFTVQDDNRIVLGDPRGPVWIAALVEENEGDALEELANNDDAGEVVRAGKFKTQI